MAHRMFRGQYFLGYVALSLVIVAGPVYPQEGFAGQSLEAVEVGEIKEEEKLVPPTRRGSVQSIHSPVLGS